MPIDFPDSPALNDTHTVGLRTWKWNGLVWESVGTTGPAGTFQVTGPTAPSAPSVGDVWYNSETGQMLVRYDGYWVESHGSLVGPTGPSGIFTVQSSTTGPTVGDGSNGDLWIVYV
jgi:hypothetical protein